MRWYVSAAVVGRWKKEKTIRFFKYFGKRIAKVYLFTLLMS